MNRTLRLIGLILCFLPILIGCSGGGSNSGSPNSNGSGSGGAVTTVTLSKNGATGALVSWTAVSGASGYNIYRSTTANQSLSSMVKVNSTPLTYSASTYYDTGLVSATTYYYKVTSVSGTNETASAEVSITTLSALALRQMGGALQGNPLTFSGATSTVATGFTTPSFIATDGTNVYLTDQGTRSILKVVPSTGISTVMLGNGSCIASICSPRGITTDGTNVYFADNSGFVGKIVISTGVASIIASGLNAPNAITTDGTYLYVADFNGIKKINIASSVSSVLTTTRVQDVTTDGTSLYVINGDAIEKVDMTTGAMSLFAGTIGAISGPPVDGIGGAATFVGPYSITSDGTSLYVAQWTTIASSLQIRKIDIATATVSTLSSASYAIGVTTDGVKIFYVQAVNNVLNALR